MIAANHRATSGDLLPFLPLSPVLVPFLLTFFNWQVELFHQLRDGFADIWRIDQSHFRPRWQRGVCGAIASASSMLAA